MGWRPNSLILAADGRHPRRPDVSHKAPLWKPLWAAHGCAR
jgi:hypothetical protein